MVRPDADDLNDDDADGCGVDKNDIDIGCCHCSLLWLLIRPPPPPPRRPFLLLPRRLLVARENAH